MKTNKISLKLYFQTNIPGNGTYKFFQSLFQTIDVMHEDRKTIRVFISSTFSDMHAERNYLNRFVMPELRSRCLLKGVELICVDLRWGLTPEESNGRGTLKICLEEMEKCKPFFVCLLGERYGWIPAPEEIPQGLFETVLRSDKLTSEEANLLIDFYKIDRMTAPPIYRLDNKGSKMSAETNTALTSLWELHDTNRMLKAGYSITAQEILKAIFDDEHRMSRAFFYLRRQGTAGIHAHPDFPDSFIPSFLEQERMNHAKLISLKEMIRTKAGELIVREYYADYAGIQIDNTLLPSVLSDKDRTALQSGFFRPEELSRMSSELRRTVLESGTVVLSGMEELGSQILDDLWAGIEAELKTEHELESSYKDKPSSRLGYHERFILNQTRLFVGRRELIDQMLRYVQNRDESSPLVFIGTAGVGKSSLLSKFVEECRLQFPAAFVLPYFIGGAPESEQLSIMLGTLCEQLRVAGGFDIEVPPDIDELRRLFPALLREVAKQKQVVLVIDALNQLDASEQGLEEFWFPFSLPQGARVIFSSQEGQSFDRLKSRIQPDNVIRIPELPVEDRRQLINESLSLRGKKLSEEHIEKLLDLQSRPDAGLPLYLLVTLEELCMFGSYEALGTRIERLPPHLPELFQQVLARLEQDHNAELVGSICCWLAASRSGLFESEILDLLRIYKPRFQTARWLRLYRAIQFYLRPMEEAGGYSSEGRISFFYEQLRLSVFERYFSMKSADVAATEKYQRAHSELADYFISTGRGDKQPRDWRADRPRVFSELPYHLTESGRWSELEATLTDIFFLESKARLGMVFDLAANLSEAAKLPLTVAACEQLLILEKALRQDIHFISRHPETLFQCFWNRCRQYKSAETGMSDEPADENINQNAFPESELQQRLKIWRTKKEQHNPDFHWVQSLQPPPSSANDEQSIVMRGHSHMVFAVAFSPDGNLIASGSKDATVRVWDAHTGEERARLFGHRNLVQSVAFSRDGRRVISGSGNPDLRTEDGTLIEEADYTVRVWNIADETEVVRFEGHQGLVHCVAVSSDGQSIASGDSDGVIKLWSLKNNFELISFSTSGHSVLSLEFSSDGSLLFSLSFDGTVRTWQAETGQELNRLTCDKPGIIRMSLSPEGNRVALTTFEGVTIYDRQSGRQINNITTAGSLAVAWSIEGRHIIGSGKGDGVVYVWEADTGMEAAVYRGHEHIVTCVAVSPDGRLFASGSMDGSVRAWALNTSKSPTKNYGHDSTVLCLRHSPDGRFFATGSEDKTVCLWNARNGKLIARLKGHSHSVISVAFLEKGRQLVSGSYDKTLLFWNTETIRKIAVIPGEPMMPDGIIATPDGKRLAYFDSKSSISVIEASTRKELFRFPCNNWAATLTVSSDGGHLAAAGQDGLVEVWSLKSGVKIASFDDGQNGIVCLGFSPDGKLLACGAIGTIKVFDLSSQMLLHNLEGHTHLVSSIAYSADGLFIVTGAEDGTVRIWSVSSGLCVGIINGGVDAGAIAAGYPWTVRVHDSHETSLASVSSGNIVGWFPAMPGMLTTLSDRRTWVGVNRTGYVYMFRLEGEEGQSISILEQVPKLNLIWDLGARQALWQGDMERFESLINHREKICREFNDTHGLSDCANLRRVVKQSNNEIEIDPQRLVDEMNRCVQSFINQDFVNAARLATDLGQKTYLDHTLLQILFISIQRSLLNERKASEEFIKQFAPVYMKPIRDSWQVQLLKTTLGQNDNIRQLLESAQTREQICQAHYYVGARLMIDGYLEDADMLFKVSLTSEADCIETVFAHVDSQTIHRILYENPNHPPI